MERRKSPPIMNVFLLFIITFITLAIYVPIWFLRRRDWLNHLSAATKELGSSLAIFVLIIYCIAVILLFVPLEVLEYEVRRSINTLISLVGVACIEILAFQVRRILIQHYNDKFGMNMNINFSGWLTFLFTIYYLQYKMNRLPISGETSGDVA